MRRFTAMRAAGVHHEQHRCGDSKSPSFSAVDYESALRQVRGMLVMRFRLWVFVCGWWLMCAPTAWPAPLERWVYCSQHLWVDKNIDELEALFRRAAKAGYTHVLLSDSKFSKLGD